MLNVSQVMGRQQNWSGWVYLETSQKELINDSSRRGIYN